jgi:hypothetical protein
MLTDDDDDDDDDTQVVHLWRKWYTFSIAGAYYEHLRQ